MDPLHSLNILTTVSTRRRGAFSMLVGPWRHSFGAALNAPERSRFIERRASPRWNGARHRAVDLWPLRFCCGMKKGRNSSLQKGNYQAVATVLDHPPSLDYTSSKRISCLVYRILSTEFLSFIFIDSFKIFVQSNIVNSWSIRFINTGGNISPS